MVGGGGGGGGFFFFQKLVGKGASSRLNSPASHTRQSVDGNSLEARLTDWKLRSDVMVISKLGHFALSVL